MGEERTPGEGSGAAVVADSTDMPEEGNGASVVDDSTDMPEIKPLPRKPRGYVNESI